MDCIFCKIISREIPGHILYEDTGSLALLDIYPSNPGHVLVIPKKHIENIYDMDEMSLFSVAKTTKRMVSAVKDAVGAQGINIMMNNEPAAGQVIFHAHVHIVPRFTKDGHTLFSHSSYKDGEAEGIAEKIRATLTRSS